MRAFGSGDGRGRARREEAVAGGGEGDARAGERTADKGGADADGHADGDERGSEVSGDEAEGVGCGAVGLRDGSGGEDVLDGRVGEHVERADDGDAADEREGQGALRVLDFAGHLRDVGPAVVGPECGDERDHEAGEAAACAGEAGCEVVPATVLDAGETEGGDDDDQQDFEPGEGGLHVGGVAGADDVEAGDDPGGGDGEDLRPQQVSEGGLREEAEDGEGAEHAHEAGGDGGDGGGLGDGDPGPGVEEGGEVAVGVAEEGVFATDAGLHGGDFGVAHGAEEREQAADDPDGVDHARTADGGHHLARDEEDSGADDDADDDGRGVRGVEDAGQVGVRLRGILHEGWRVACGWLAR